MGFFKKTILLSNQGNYSAGMAILNIEQTGAGVFASLKAFDIKKTNLLLGVSLNGKEIVKQDVIFSNNNIFNFRLNSDFDCNGKIGCVLVERYKNDIKPIIWGSNGMTAEYKEDIINNINNENVSSTKVVVSADDVVPNTLKTDDIESSKSNNIHDNKEIKSQNDIEQLFESSEDDIEDIIDKELDGGFYGVIQDQLNSMFGKYPLDEELMQIVPDSKWIKVDYDDSDKEYVLGLMYENGQVKYICYGVPGDQSVEPPKELMPFSQWIATSKGGYWVMFQDSITGDNIVIDNVKFS